MIKTREDLKQYLETDRKALKKERSFKAVFKQFIWPDEIWRFEKLLRYTEYYCNCSGGGHFFIASMV